MLLFLCVFCVLHPLCNQARDGLSFGISICNAHAVWFDGQDSVPRCRLFYWWALISAARVHAFTAPRETAGAPTAERTPSRPERTDVKRRARRLSLPTAMVAGAAALILTTTLQAAPVAQADEVSHAAGFTANLDVEQDARRLGQPRLPLLAQRGQSGRAALRRRRRQAGKVYAYHLNGGTGVAGWPYNAGAPVDSSPSVAPISPDGTDSVFIGSGDAAEPTTGGYQAITNTGGDQWFVQETNPGTDSVPHSGVVGLPDRRQLRRRVRRGGGIARVRTRTRWAPATGRCSAGSRGSRRTPSYSTAAVADLYADGNNELISGGDSTAGRGLRADLQQRRAHPHLVERRERRDGQPCRWPHLRVQHHPEHRPLVARRRPVPLRRCRRHRHR